MRAPDREGCCAAARIHTSAMHRAVFGTVLLLWPSFILQHVSGASVVSLSGTQWLLQNSNLSISLPTTLPAYPLEVLRINKVIEDPLLRYGEAQSRWVAAETWTFSTTFNSNDPSIASVMASQAVQLRLDGLDTFATVQLNGKDVLTANNFHRRWFVPVKQLLVTGTNKLSVTIKPATAQSLAQRDVFGFWPLWMAPKGVGAFNMARKPASDFGWDWGPAYAPSGIHGGVDLVGYDHAIIQASSLAQKEVGTTFQLVVTLDMQVPSNAEAGTVVVSLPSLKLAASMPVNLAGPGLQQVSVQLNVAETAVKRWWPLGYGTPQLYDLQVTYTPTSPAITCQGSKHTAGLAAAEATGAVMDTSTEMLNTQQQQQHQQDVASCIKAAQSSFTRRVGFRNVELVRRPPAQAVKELLPPGEPGWGEQPGDGETYYFKVNGVPIFAKGANLVPLRVVHSMMTKGVVADTIDYALATNMNMIRVWGGGTYQVEDFWDLADQHGLMIWVDSMFACAQYPNSEEFLSNVAVETTQQAQRLSWHPSLVMWAGNNENEQALDWFTESVNNREYYMDAYVALFVDTIRSIVRMVVPQVPYVDGSPNKGVTSDDGQSYTKRWGNVNSVETGDVHYYTYGCQPGCNDCENANIYPKARFVSEFGIQSYPSWETLSVAMGAADQSVDSGQMYWRQRKFSDAPSSVFGFAGLHFRMADDWGAGDAANKQSLLQSFLYLTHMQQARCYQSALSYWRRLRANPGALTMGALYWQLNDVAPYASWSGYDAGGRWKPLSYYVRRSFAPLAVHVLEAWGKVEVWVLNDFTTAQPLTITVRLLSLTKSYPSATPAACASELQPVKVLSVQAPPNFAKWLWSISVDDLLQSQPGCTRTTCYVHVSTALGSAQEAQEAAHHTWHMQDSHSDASVSGVKLSAAEAHAPAALWPTEGTSPDTKAVMPPEAVLSSDPAAAAATGVSAAAGDSSQGYTTGVARGAAAGAGPVPDVQLLLASPRDINFLDPGLVARKSTGLSLSLQASTAASNVMLTSAYQGYFSDNALTALHPCLPQTVTFSPHSSVQQLTPDALLSSLKIESLFNHQFGSASDGGGGGNSGGGGDGGWGWWPKGPNGSGSSPGPAQGSSRVFFAGSVIGNSSQPGAPAHKG